MKEVHFLERSGWGKIIPLHNRFKVGNSPIIATERIYFSSRNLRFADGKLWTNLGDAVLGASFARKEGLKIGDHIISS